MGNLRRVSGGLAALRAAQFRESQNPPIMNAENSQLPSEAERTIVRGGKRVSGQGESMARRRYQTGSLSLRGKRVRVWVLRWREDVIGIDGHTERIKRSVVLGTLAEIPTRKLARRQADVLLARVNSSSYRASRVATIGDFSERWKKEVLSQRKPSTIMAAELHLRKHILPALSKFRLDEITVERQQSFVSELSAHVGRKTLLNVLSTLSSVLSTASAWGYMVEIVNRKKLALPRRTERPAMRWFTVEEILKIVAAANEPLATICFMFAVTGMREGELFAIKVSDVDFDRKIINVRRSVWRGKMQSTKSQSSVRVLHMPDALAGRLKNYLLTWRPNALGLLFPSRTGTPINPNHVVPRKLHPLLDKLGINRAGFHAFRHSHSSLLIELGAAPTVAQAQLGHSDLTTTLRTYTHLIPESRRSAVEKLAVILAPNGPKLLPN